MRKILFLVLATLAAGAAQAQIKCWNEGSRRVCGDAPPAGAKVKTINTPAAPAAPAATSKADAKDAGSKAAAKGPVTPAEQEQAYRKRQADSRKAADKAAVETKDAEAKRANCEAARESLRAFESGRVAKFDAKGERYFLDESQLAAESANARKIAQDSCN